MASTKEKALQLLRESRLGYHLVHVWLEIRYYPSWSKRDDFEAKWNFGLANVSSGERAVSIRGRDKTLTFLRASFDGRRFEIASDQSPVWWPDDEAFAVETLLLDWNGRRVANVNFTVHDDGIIPSHFHLISVEELHWSDDWTKSIERMSKAIDAWHTHKRETERELEEIQTRDKFTLPGESKSSLKRESASLSSARSREGTNAVRDANFVLGAKRRASVVLALVILVALVVLVLLLQKS
jgi:hypothetical protein